MSGHMLDVLYPEEKRCQTGINKIQLRGLDQPFAQIAVVIHFHAARCVRAQIQIRREISAVPLYFLDAFFPLFLVSFVCGRAVFSFYLLPPAQLTVHFQAYPYQTFCSRCPQ